MVARDLMKIFDYFEGNFDEQIYGNVLLEGNLAQTYYTVEAVLAIYPNERSYHSLASKSGMCADLVSKLPSYELKPEDYASPTAVAHEAAAMFTDDELLWRRATRETDPLGLPMSFIGHLSLLEGGPRVVMWYSQYAAPGWALRQFKRRAQSN